MTTRYSVTFIEDAEHTIYVQLEVESPDIAEKIARQAILDSTPGKPRTYPVGVYDYRVERVMRPRPYACLEEGP